MELRRAVSRRLDVLTRGRVCPRPQRPMVWPPWWLRSRPRSCPVPALAGMVGGGLGRSRNATKTGGWIHPHRPAPNRWTRTEGAPSEGAANEPPRAGATVEMVRITGPEPPMLHIWDIKPFSAPYMIQSPELPPSWPRGGSDDTVDSPASPVLPHRHGKLSAHRPVALTVVPGLFARANRLCCSGACHGPHPLPRHPPAPRIRG